MEIFFETKDVYLLKDLEKVAPKMKGITSMSVKDVLTSLVDDGLVDTEKIGTSVYFWAFPSKASQNRKRKIDTLNEQVEEVKRKRKTAEAEIAQTSFGREETDERESTLASLNETQAECTRLQ